MDVGGAVDFPHSNWNDAFRIGIGSRADLSFAFDSTWTAGLGLGYFHYQGNDASGPVIIDELRVLPMVRFYPMTRNSGFYFTGGAGLAVQFAAVSGTIAGHLNPDGFLGAGVEMHLAAEEAIFFEVNYSLMLADSVQAQDVEAIIGLRSCF